jgi:hypothetical protein
MFRVDVDNLKSYFDFDPKRTIDLQKLNKLARESAPGLRRYFHRGTPQAERLSPGHTRTALSG